MLDLNLGQIIMLGAGLALVFAGLLGLAPILLRGRSPAREGSARIHQQDLLALPDVVSLPPAQTVAEADEGLIEELFAELFSIRAALAALTNEVRSLHSIATEQGRTPGAPEDAADEGKEPPLRAAA